MQFSQIVKKILNVIIPKSKTKVYVCPHENGKTDKYDLLNYTGDNALAFLNYLNDTGVNCKSDFYVECYSKERIETIIKAVTNWNIKIIPVLSKSIIEESSVSKWRTLKNNLIRYRCSIWITCSQHSNYTEKTKAQKNICLSYSTPLKTGLIDNRHYNYYKFLDHYCETSLLTASVHAAQYHNYLNDSPIIGFARNDFLFESPKKAAVIEWLSSKVDMISKPGVIVYAPTYRDYEKAYNDVCVLGYDVSPEELDTFLEKNNLYLIVKFHPWQKISAKSFTSRIIQYEKTYNFSLYDVLSVSDMLISDYSSVIHDYILTDKPIVLDLFDYELYKDSRGFAFDPIDYICPGEMCYTFEEIKDAILSELVCDKRSKKYDLVKNMFHKYFDNKSSERTWKFLKQYID